MVSDERETMLGMQGFLKIGGSLRDPGEFYKGRGASAQRICREISTLTKPEYKAAGTVLERGSLAGLRLYKV